MLSRSAFSTFVLSFALAALADVTPTEPGPGDVFQQGGSCTIGWNPDQTGTWKELNIELMTGDNFNMVHLTSPSYCIYFSSDGRLTPFSTSCRYRRRYHLPWYILLPVSCCTCHWPSTVDFPQSNVFSALGHARRTYLFLPVLHAFCPYYQDLDWPLYYLRLDG